MLKLVGQKLLLVLGLAALGVGIVGIFIPLLPTTPLVLLSAYLFARSSPRYHQWIRNNKYFGKTVRSWEAGEGLTVREKRRMIIAATLFIGISFILCSNILGRIVLLLAWPIPLAVALFTRTRKE